MPDALPMKPTDADPNRADLEAPTGHGTPRGAGVRRGFLAAESHRCRTPCTSRPSRCRSYVTSASTRGALVRPPVSVDVRRRGRRYLPRPSALTGWRGVGETGRVRRGQDTEASHAARRALVAQVARDGGDVAVRHHREADAVTVAVQGVDLVRPRPYRLKKRPPFTSPQLPSSA